MFCAQDIIILINVTPYHVAFATLGLSRIEKNRLAIFRPGRQTDRPRSPEFGAEYWYVVMLRNNPSTR